MSRLDTIADSTPVRHYRFVGWAIMALLTAFLVWAQFATLEEVSIATGEVIPSGEVKVIQHLEGGIIEQIFVHDGAHVTAGEPLVQLDLVSSQASEDELEVSLDALLLARARLEAEASGEDLQFPEDVAARRPEFARQESQSFEARRSELESTIGVLKEQVNQRKDDLEEANRRQSGLRDQLAVARERLTMAEDLLPQQLVSRVDYLEAQQTVERLQTELAAIGPAITRAQAALNEATQRIAEKEKSYRREALGELSQREVEIARAREALLRASDKTRRTTIVSPIDGVVKNLQYNTIGGVLRPGDSIMEIVPTADNLVIQGHLNPIDIGYVRVGQHAVVKLSTYDYARYGGLEGEVTYISADTYTTQQGETYFEVRAETDKNYLGETEDEYPISPGMQATIDIHTGKKSVMEYLLKPVLKLKTEAFRER